MAYEELNLYMKEIFINLGKTDHTILLGLVASLRFFLCTNYKHPVSMARTLQVQLRSFQQNINLKRFLKEIYQM